MVWTCTEEGVLIFWEKELPGRSQRGSPKRRFSDVEREDIQIVVVREEDAEDRERQAR